MKAYAISYDLRVPGKDYSSVIAAIKEFPAWASPTKSQWLVMTRLSAAEVRDLLTRHMDSNDVLFVQQVVINDWAGWNLPTAVVNWLQSAAVTA